MKFGNLNYFKKKEENQIYENLELLLRTKFFCLALLSFFFLCVWVFFFLCFSLFLSLKPLLAVTESLSLYVKGVVVWSLETNGGVCCCNDQNVLVFYVFCFLFLNVWSYWVFYLFQTNMKHVCQYLFCVSSKKKKKYFFVCVLYICPYLVGWKTV